MSNMSDAAIISTVDSQITWHDRLGCWKARWGINRYNFTVTPGLHALGRPGSQSPVLITSNYRMTFDRVREALTGRDTWILVLDTQGINVWCAAGKGTFGTEELVRKISETGLTDLVTHRHIVVPQLGAPGVAAHEVHKATGFRVVYGPVRATDIPAFLDAGMKTSPDMRRVRFDFRDRVILIPMELVFSGKYIVPAMLVTGLLSGFRGRLYTVDHLQSGAPPILITLLLGWLSGAAIGPALLPWLPGRSFAFKGLMAGILGLLLFPAAALPLHLEPLDVLMALTVIPVVSSFLTLLFTGSSPYTSLSGVRQEMKVAVPIQLAIASMATGIWIVARFI